MAKNKNDRRDQKPQSVEGREFYAGLPTMSNAQPLPVWLGLSTHESGPRAGDIGYP